MTVCEIDITGFSSIFGNTRGTGAPATTPEQDIESGLEPSLAYLYDERRLVQVMGGIVEHGAATPEERLGARQFFNAFMYRFVSGKYALDALDDALKQMQKENKGADYIGRYEHKTLHIRLAGLLRAVAVYNTDYMVIATTHEEANEVCLRLDALAKR